MIRSSKSSLKFSNTGKKESLSSFIDEYQKLTSFFIDTIWDMDIIPSLLPKEITSKSSTWLSARMIQCAGKQASGIVRGTQRKQRARMWRYKKLLEDGRTKDAEKLLKFIDKTKVTKPDIKSLCPELDSRFIKLDLKEDGFCWITITSIGNRMKLILPFKRTAHFNKLLKNETIKSGIRISRNNATFMFDREIKLKESGSKIGIDVGINKCFVTSDNIHSQEDIHGHSLKSITQKLTRKKKGSKSFKKADSHRTNYVNWSLNQLNLSGVKEVNIEKLRDMRRGKRTSRYLSHFTYTAIRKKIESLCEQSGVLINEVEPSFTSLRCSCCGWVRSSNRKKELFECSNCGFATDADYNASLNIRMDFGLPRSKRRSYSKKTGFFLLVSGQEHIVPDTQEVSFHSLL